MSAPEVVQANTAPVQQVRRGAGDYTFIEIQDAGHSAIRSGASRPTRAASTHQVEVSKELVILLMQCNRNTRSMLTTTHK